MVRISNLKLIRILEKNARTPFVEIAKALGVSEAAVRKRIRKLEEMGVIRRYTIDVDYKKLGFNVHALIGVDTEPESYVFVIEKLRTMDEVKSLYASTGDHMLLLECVFDTPDKLMSFAKKLESMRGVTRVCPAILLEKLK